MQRCFQAAIVGRVSGAVNGGQGEPSVIGTNKRVAKADFRYFDDKHNFDCWDTTRNTTSLLLVLQQWGLLKYHLVGDPHYRGIALEK